MKPDPRRVQRPESPTPASGGDSISGPGFHEPRSGHVGEHRIRECPENMVRHLQCCGRSRIRREVCTDRSQDLHNLAILSGGARMEKYERYRIASARGSGSRKMVMFTDPCAGISGVGVNMLCGPVGSMCRYISGTGKWAS